MTSAERLLALLTEVDDVLVEEAAQPFFPAPAKKSWSKWAGLAACLLLAAGLVRISPFFLGGGMGSAEADGAPQAPENSSPQESSAIEMEPSAGIDDPGDAAPGDVPPTSGESVAGDGDSGSTGDAGKELPVLSASCQFAEGAGGSGIWTDDVNSYISDSLSLDTAGNTLPVYASILPRDENGDPVSTDEAAMEALLADILFRFGLTPDDCALTSRDLGIAGKHDVLGYLEAVTPDGTEITVDHHLISTVTLPLDSFPETLQSPDDSNFDSLISFGEALIDELGWLLGMDTPVPVITGGDVNLYGETQFCLTIRDGAASDPTSPIAYGIGVVDNRLILRLDSRAGRELLGEYPIITQDEATDQLLTGSWVGYNENWHVIPTAEQLLRTELVYCTNVDGYTMPYYRFYLDLGETVELCEPGTQLSTGETVPWIALCYIPAVEAQHLTPESSPMGNR